MVSCLNQTHDRLNVSSPRGHVRKHHPDRCPGEQQVAGCGPAVWKGKIETSQRGDPAAETRAAGSVPPPAAAQEEAQGARGPDSKRFRGTCRLLLPIYSPCVTLETIL